MKKILIGLLIIFVGLLVSGKLAFKVSYKESFQHENISELTRLISFDYPNDQIIDKIKQDNSWLHERCDTCLVLSHRTPLICALENERSKVVVSMIQHGVSVQDTVEIIYEIKRFHYLEKLNDIVLKNSLEGQLDCDISLLNGPVKDYM